MAGPVRRSRHLAPEHPIKKLVDGETFPWLGHPARLRLADLGPPIERRSVQGHGRDTIWELTLRRSTTAVDRGRKALIDWYCRQGLAWLTDATHGPYWEDRLRIGEPVNYLVCDLGRRHWGAHRPATNTVAFHWALFQLPEDVVELVLAHQLVHETRPPGDPHGDAFNRRFDEAMPDRHQRTARLIEVGGHAWLGDVSA